MREQSEDHHHLGLSVKYVPGMNTFSKMLSLKRISKKRFYSILGLSVLSLIVLTYQTIDYLHGLACCGDTLPEIVQAFREYGTFFGIPISVFGILLMLSTIVFLVFLSMAPLPTDHPRFPQVMKSIYYVFLIELLLSSVLVVNLIYIEFVVIQSFCLPCTISQIVIFSNTLLVYFWKPFR